MLPINSPSGFSNCLLLRMIVTFHLCVPITWNNAFHTVDIQQKVLGWKKGRKEERKWKRKEGNELKGLGINVVSNSQSNLQNRITSGKPVKNGSSWALSQLCENQNV